MSWFEAQWFTRQDYTDNAKRLNGMENSILNLQGLWGGGGGGGVGLFQIYYDNISDGAFLCKSNQTHLPLYQQIDTSIQTSTQWFLLYIFSEICCSILQMRLKLACLWSLNIGLVTKIKQCIMLRWQCMLACHPDLFSLTKHLNIP